MRSRASPRTLCAGSRHQEPGGLEAVRGVFSRGDRDRSGGQLTRFLILRLLGFVYFFAFLSLAQQVLPLIGRDGLLPARSYLAGIERAVGSRFDAFLALPSLFWLGAPDRL